MQNLKPIKERTSSELREMTRKGGIASGKARQEKKTMRQLAEICLGAKLTKPEIEAKLKEAGLPATYGGQMLFNAVQMAGRNSNMLRVVLELIGEVKQAQTNVTVTLVCCCLTSPINSNTTRNILLFRPAICTALNSI